MKPIEFEQQNKLYTRPADMTDEECSSLPVYQDNREIISCWQMSWKERFKALLTGKIWFSVLAQRQPPICLSVESFFVEVKNEID